MHDLTTEERSLSERMDDVIRAGILQAKERKRRIRSRNRIRSAAAAVCGLALIACLFTIRISPVFASMLRDIPGFEKFVGLIDRSNDRGLKLAADNDLVQPVGLSDEHDGGKFTVEGIIADQSRMVVFYELESDTVTKTLRISDARMKDAAGANLQYMISYGNGEISDEHGRSVVRGTVDVWLQDGGQWPDEVRLVVGESKESGAGTASDVPEPTQNVDGPDSWATNLHPPSDTGVRYQVTFPIDRKKFDSLVREYPIGQTIQIEGQRIVFERAVFSPLRIALYLDYPEDNSKRIFGPGDIRLVDEEGGEWQTTGATSSLDGHPVIYFESNYFHRPKHLTIEGSWFRALDKSKLQVSIDTEKKQIVQAPDDRLELDNVVKSDTYTMIKLALKNIPKDDNMGYSVLDSQFTDATGTVYQFGDEGRGRVSTYRVSNEWGTSYMFYYLSNRDYEQPLTFKITQYPAYIRTPYRVKIW